MLRTEKDVRRAESAEGEVGRAMEGRPEEGEKEKRDDGMGGRGGGIPGGWAQGQ